MAEYLKEDDIALLHVKKFREYGISIIDGGSSVIKINYCPWCGVKLERSLRHEWFEQLAELSLDPISDELPNRFKNDEWWKTGL